MKTALLLFGFAASSACYQSTDDRTLVGVYPSEPFKTVAAASSPTTPQVIRLLAERDTGHEFPCLDLNFEMRAAVYSEVKASFQVSVWKHIVSGADAADSSVPPVFADAPDRVQLVPEKAGFEEGGSISSDCSFGRAAWLDLQIVFETFGQPIQSEIMWGASANMWLASEKHADSQRLKVFQWSGTHWSELSVTRTKRGPSKSPIANLQ